MKRDFGTHLVEALQEALHVSSSALSLSLSKGQQSPDALPTGSAIRRYREQSYSLEESPHVA